MRLRLVSFILVLLTIVAAVVVSDRAKPIMLVDQHSSGQWLFSETDYPICVTAKPPALRSTRPSYIQGPKTGAMT